MQTKINKKMAFGIPGTHGNGQPYYADPYVAGGTVTFGTLAGLDATGRAVAWTTGDVAGLIVNPNEHVRMVLPSSERSLSVDQGATVAIAKKGAWFVAVPTADKANWKKGAKLIADTTTHALKVSASGTYGEVLEVDDDATLALIRLI